jgi:hypothetical protein
MASSSLSSSAAPRCVGAREYLADLPRDPIRDIGHVADDAGELVRHRFGRVPPQRGLRDVLGEVAHALDVGRDVQRGDDEAQIGGDGACRASSAYTFSSTSLCSWFTTVSPATTPSATPASALSRAVVARFIALRTSSAMATSSPLTSASSAWNSSRISSPVE